VSHSRLIVVLAAYGVVNAAAYSCLLPLWEGFDEAYHYGYVQFLSTHLRFPVLGQTVLSREIWRSFQLVPVSHYIQPFTGAPTNFADYFALSPDEREQRRMQLESIPAGEKYLPQADKSNYEASQSPLPYLFMAIIDRVLLGNSLPMRVLWVRMICAVLAILLLVHSTILLSTQLVLADMYYRVLLFCVFSSQMLYATVCHVCNDWLAIPLMVYLIWSAIRTAETGSRHDCLGLGLVTAAALLTKAYFLFLVPLAVGWIGWALWRKRATLTGLAWFAAPLLLLAGPWYLRNLLLYHDLSGTGEKMTGVGPTQLLNAALALPWRESIVNMAHSGLWTANNSFSAFSATTVDIALMLVTGGLVLYFVRAKRQIAEWTVVTAAALFCCGLAAITVSFYAGSKGAVSVAMPWYLQLLLVPVLLLALLGLSRSGRWGRILSPLFVLLWGYMLAATYLVKLTPLYAGFPQSRTHWMELQTWYFQNGSQMSAMLRTVCLVGPSVLWALIGSSVVLDVAICTKLIAGAVSTDRH
jgi:hypothetical protein